MFCICKNLFNRSSDETRYFKINQFMHKNPGLYLTEKQLYKVFRLYRKWTVCARYRSLALERGVLHYIAKRAFWSDLEDSDFVANIMLYMHHVGTHFGYFLCPWADCYPKDVSSNLRARFANYFLYHSNRRRLAIGEKRVMNILLNFRSGMRHPCEIAVTCCCPNLLLVLLQYGALAMDSELTMYSLVCMGNILRTLTCIIRLALDMARHYALEFGSLEDHPKYQSMVHCGRLMVRVCPQVDKSYLFTENVVSFPGFPCTEEAFKWVVQNVLPELEHRLFQPLQLKHACRLKIRKALYNNWQLPCGIKSLSLPESLRMYLNLYSD